MKLKERNSKDRQSPPTRCGRVMKQQKLNFFTDAKKRSIVDSESHTNNNKKQKLIDGKEDDNNNNNNNNGKLKPKRLSRSCNKENFEPKSDGSELDISQTAREGKDGKGKKLSEATNIVGGHRDQKKTREDEYENDNKNNGEHILKKSEKAKNREKGDDEKCLDAMRDDVAKQIFSNSMKDAVKTKCRICR